MKLLHIVSALLLGVFPMTLAAQNQTDTTTPILSEDLLDYTLTIEQASFSLPIGLQAYSSAIYDNYWIFIGGRTNGLHGFDNIGNNFPPNFQNTTIYLIDHRTGDYFSRSMLDSDLPQSIIDDLSGTAQESFQKDNLLYVVGGYGIDTLTNTMGTKSSLSEINLKKLITWVKYGKTSLKNAIRQVDDPLLQVAGGQLFQASNKDPFLLMVGQNFIGNYTPGSNGIYTEQIRSFRLKDVNGQLTLVALGNSSTFPDYRRRDLNAVPIFHFGKPAYVILSGVFTIAGGIWTVPITVFADGISNEPIPNALNTFKQGMNNYNCPVISLYSHKSKEMFIILPGGLSYGYFSEGVFTTDEEIPFINQVTTVKIDPSNQFSQHLMNAEYPFIASTGTNPGNQLLFGAEAAFFPAKDVCTYSNGVINYDSLKNSQVIGYIAGGIMSTLPNTNTRADSTASPYIFTVRLNKKVR